MVWSQLICSREFNLISWLVLIRTVWQTAKPVTVIIKRKKMNGALGLLSSNITLQSETVDAVGSSHPPGVWWVEVRKIQILLYFLPVASDLLGFQPGQVCDIQDIQVWHRGKGGCKGFIDWRCKVGGSQSVCGQAGWTEWQETAEARDDLRLLWSAGQEAATRYSWLRFTNGLKEKQVTEQQLSR